MKPTVCQTQDTNCLHTMGSSINPYKTHDRHLQQTMLAPPSQHSPEQHLQRHHPDSIWRHLGQSYSIMSRTHGFTMFHLEDAGLSQNWTCSFQRSHWTSSLLWSHWSIILQRSHWSSSLQWSTLIFFWVVLARGLFQKNPKESQRLQSNDGCHSKHMVHFIHFCNLFYKHPRPSLL